MIKVVVVDDSLFFRRALTYILEQDKEIKVVGQARNGFEALEMVKELKPDILTLDVMMPGMDGLSFLKKLMETNPMPVLMVSALTPEGADVSLAAMAAGALDVVAKPDGQVSVEIWRLAQELIEKVKVLSGVELKKKPVDLEREVTFPQLPDREFKAIVFGCSTGGPQALYELLTSLPASFKAAILIAQHMPPGFTKILAERLDEHCPFRIKEAQDGDEVSSGVAFIIPSHFNALVRKKSKRVVVELKKPTSQDKVVPSVNLLMASAAKVYNESLIGVILTGMGNDGSQGLAEIKKRGGLTIAESRESCVVYGMPRVAIESGAAQYALPLSYIKRTVAELLNQNAVGVKS
jgi:two-component system chemotaxis response regulator CheB